MSVFYPIMVAMVFNLLDLVTGLIAAVREKDVKSSKLRDGLFKKVGFIVCYFVAWMIDTYGYLIGFTLSVHILPVMVLYTCTTELVSILENVTKINPDILPDRLMQIFHIDDIRRVDK